MKLIPTVALLTYAVKAQDASSTQGSTSSETTDNRTSGQKRFDRLVGDASKAAAQVEAPADNASSDDSDGSSSSGARPALEASGRFLAKDDLVMLQAYGCWCYFEEERGRGRPVDVFDESCKVLQDGYECIRRDAADRNIQCNVWDTTYTSAVGFGGLSPMTMNQLRDECDTANGIDSCQSWICRVEGWFTQSIIQHYFRDFLFPQDTYSHSRGNFNPDAQCEIKVGVFSEKECCGEYPIRFPFKTQGGTRACCVNKTYNADMNKCCSDGSTRPVCDDPAIVG